MTTTCKSVTICTCDMCKKEIDTMDNIYSISDSSINTPFGWLYISHLNENKIHASAIMDGLYFCSKACLIKFFETYLLDDE